MTVLFVIYALIITNYINRASCYNDNTKEVTSIISKYNIDGNKLTIYLKAKEVLIINYYIKTKKDLNYYKNNIELGDKIEVKGTFNKPSKNTVPNTFNYHKYLYNNNIHYIIKANKIKKVSNNTSIFYYIKTKITKRINKIDKTGYLKIFIIGEKGDIDPNTLDNYRTNGISHLFSISGMHISLLAGIILYILRKVSYNIKLNYLIVIIFLVFYLYLTDFSPSILRTTIMYIIIALNKSYNLKIKNIDIILLVLIIAIIINPFYLYNIGFQYSYLISFTLILQRRKISSINNKMIKSLYISYLCFIISFPTSIYNFYQVNFLSIFINIILIPIVSIIIYPLSLITFIIPKMSILFIASISILEYLNNIVSNITILQIVFPKPSLMLIFIYYFLIYLSINNKKYLIILVSIITITKISISLNENILLTSIDVGQGDSTFVKIPNNNILIDTGGITSYKKEKWMNQKEEYSIVKNKTIPYLKSLGISKISYLIITHGDYDHMGEAINLVNNFKVEKVIFNCGPYNDLEKELIKVLNKEKIKYYSCIKELNIDKNELNFLQTKEYDNENDNSNVIYTELNGYKFMFMGDASLTTEKEILNKYNLPDIDVLKVGHHGSKTSSSKEFINEINPKYSIISVGKNNRYGHPNKEVLNNLDNSKIYRTDQDGSIMFKIKKRKLKIETCVP
ncbi:MAG: DNA internalization-related competence protein ComEC/Rec2 [Bacilli bacterium]|nr:DNA internalization-related competence protein ComEC/Rec2 [Bacilli bacterium]